ncbi:hypothetical protein M0805_007186 [Coniferiporia weirii]|nr:hypothetical protein M0805_007186 [Coniferiporia weirii]
MLTASGSDSSQRVGGRHTYLLGPNIVWFGEKKFNGGGAASGACARPPARPCGAILLAEDNLVNQKLAVKILEKYGHAVEIAENGSLAVDSFKLRVAQGRPFDIVLMDVSMPFMGGMEATELIRAFELLERAPIIALTAHAMIGDRERCLQAGMDDHITKPLRRGDLLNAINKLAGEKATKDRRKHHALIAESLLR